MSHTWPWVTFALLGAFHGLNPAMGWLFAVALGLQERSRRAVLEAIPPIALGHVMSIALILGALGFAQAVVPPRELRLACGALLVVFGLYKLAKRNAHPRWVGMRVGFADLVLWSFLMASAHGAGLMLVPVVLRMPADAREAAPTVMHHPPEAFGEIGAMTASAGVVALVVHTAALLLVMTVIAVIVFEVLGLKLLRRAWINLDLVWSAALIVAGVVTVGAR